MLFAEHRRQARPTYALSPSTAVAALAQLREQAIPALVEAPHFRIRRPAAVARTRPAWLTRALDFASAHTRLLAIAAALVLALATALPAWAALTGPGAGSTFPTIHSSAGVTGTASTRVENLGVTTFVGRVPFVQQMQYYSSTTTGGSAPQLFLQGAREASVAEYLQAIGLQVTLPYLNDALATQDAIDTWTEASIAAHRQRLALEANGVTTAWEAQLPATGTVMPSTTTFYSCIGNGFCGTMATGAQVYAGAAACSYDLPFGTRFFVNGDPARRVFTCMDRGALTSTWVDIWFYDAADGWAWQSIVGTHSAITIIE